MRKEKIFVAGHRGMVGSAIARQLESDTTEIITRSHNELDLTDQSAVREFFHRHKPTQVYLAAAKVGGIHANSTYPADFIYQNLAIQNNVIHEAWKAGVERLLFLGSSCIYPKLAKQPINESELLSGQLESTNEPYAIAKIAGIKLCESYNRQYGVDYRSVMPTNLYGPGDNYNFLNSHVIPALLRKFHLVNLASNKKLEEIKLDISIYGDIPEEFLTFLHGVVQGSEVPRVVIWGTGNAMREFLHVDDMAAASIHVMNLSSSEYRAITSPMLSHINVGTGVDMKISDLAALIARVVGYTGAVDFDTSKPDGTPRKLLDVSKLELLKFKASIGIEEGLVKTYMQYKSINK